MRLEINAPKIFSRMIFSLDNQHNNQGISMMILFVGHYSKVYVFLSDQDDVGFGQGMRKSLLDIQL